MFQNLVTLKNWRRPSEKAVTHHADYMSFLYWFMIVLATDCEVNSQLVGLDSYKAELINYKRSVLDYWKNEIKLLYTFILLGGN